MIHFPKQLYPETATFIEEAIAESGKNRICMIDRSSVEERKEESSNKLPSKKGYHTALWPLPICKEGGADASVDYVLSYDHEEAEKWILIRKVTR